MEKKNTIDSSYRFSTGRGGWGYLPVTYENELCIMCNSSIMYQRLMVIIKVTEMELILFPWRKETVCSDESWNVVGVALAPCRSIKAQRAKGKEDKLWNDVDLKEWCRPLVSYQGDPPVSLELLLEEENITFGLGEGPLFSLFFFISNAPPQSP